MPLLKGLSRSPLMVRIGSALAEAYLRLVFRTSRVTRDPRDTDAKLLSQHPQIFAMWHGQALTMPMIKPAEHAEIAVIVSRHGDAEIMAKTLQRFGMRVVRGAGDAGRRPNNRGGSAALRSALRVLKDGATFAMTADVPPGPARRAGEGIVLLAKLSGRPIVPCAMVTKRYFALNSWSTYTINLPFSRLAIVVGEPIWVPPAATSEELEKSRISVEEGLSEVTARAYAMAGSVDPHLARCARGEAPRLRKR